MTLDQIKAAVDAGKVVRCAGPAYAVIRDSVGQYLIVCTSNAYAIGLTWADGATLNGKEEEFYIEGTMTTMNKLASYFTASRRDNGDTFTTLRDGAPEWLLAAVRDAHRGDMPSDWVWATCRATCEAIDDGSITIDDDCDVHEFADGLVDVYTKNLAAWYEEFCLSNTFAEAMDEAQEGGLDDAAIDKQLPVVQYYAIRYIAEVMANAANDALVTAE